MVNKLTDRIMTPFYSATSRSGALIQTQSQRFLETKDTQVFL